MAATCGPESAAIRDVVHFKFYRHFDDDEGGGEICLSVSCKRFLGRTSLETTINDGNAQVCDASGDEKSDGARLKKCIK